MTQTHSVIHDPNYLAYALDFESETVEFLPLEEDDLRHVTWLKRDTLASSGEGVKVPLAQVVRVLSAEDNQTSVKPVHFIFHTAYCASTFLSRCLDVPSSTVSLREPQILLDAANAKRIQWQARTVNIDFRHLPSLALRLLQKHARTSEKLIIKPINSVNNIIPELLQTGAVGRALLLYTDARNFLLSTFKKGEEARQTVRAMFDLLRCDFPHLSKLQLSNAIHMSDLKVTLTLWRLQIEQAEQYLRHYAATDAIASLYAERLIADPEAVLPAVNQYMQLGLNEHVLTEMTKGDSRFRDAKNPQESFSLETRQQRYTALEALFGQDIDNGLRWLTDNNPGTSLVPSLSSPLRLHE